MSKCLGSGQHPHHPKSLQPLSANWEVLSPFRGKGTEGVSLAPTLLEATQRASTRAGPSAQLRVAISTSLAPRTGADMTTAARLGPQQPPAGSSGVGLAEAKVGLRLDGGRGGRAHSIEPDALPGAKPTSGLVLNTSPWDSPLPPPPLLPSCLAFSQMNQASIHLFIQ